MITSSSAASFWAYQRERSASLFCLFSEERVSPQTVTRTAKRLDDAVRAFHRRRIIPSFRALILDGIVIKRKTGAGTLKRSVLVALGIREDGRKEVIDFHLAKSESGPEWRTFLTDLINRGLTSCEVICADGGQGLTSILPEVYPHIPLQRCWAHKIRNILDKVPKKKQAAVKTGLQKTLQRPGQLQKDGPAHGSRNTRRLSRAYRMILMICSPASSSLILISARQ